MDYNLNPSLEHRASAIIAGSLWVVDDKYWTRSYLSFVSRDWDVRVARVIEKACTLPLPRLLKDRLVPYIRAMGRQLVLWQVQHEMFLNRTACGHYDESDLCEKFKLRKNWPYSFGKDNVSKVCWSSVGIVDRKRTAQSIVEDENIDLCHRFELACWYCLEKDIYGLRGRLWPEDIIPYLLNAGKLERFYNFLKFWITDAPDDYTVLCLQRRGKYDELWMPLIQMNQGALRYFMQQFRRTADLQEYFAMNAVRMIRWHRVCLRNRENPVYDGDFIVDAICKLLLRMDKAHRRRVFKGNAKDLLICFLNWPYQDRFMDMATELDEFLTLESRYQVLKNIYRNMEQGFKDYNYRYLFKAFWKQSTLQFKEFVIQQFVSRKSFLCDHFLFRDKEVFRLVFRSLDVKDRENIILGKNGLALCRRLLEDEFSVWWLEMLLDICLSTEAAALKLKEHLQPVLHLPNVKDYARNRFLNFIDGFIALKSGKTIVGVAKTKGKRVAEKKANEQATKKRRKRAK